MPAVVDLAPDLVEPRFCFIPPIEYTHGEEVGELAAMVGLAPEPEQQLALDVIFATTKAGLPLVFEIDTIGPRRNIKTSLYKMTSLGWLHVDDVKTFAYTGHLWNPACAEMFRDMKELHDNFDFLRRRVKKINEGKGEQEIELLSRYGGGRMVFRTRSNGAGNAAEFDKVIVDEGKFLKREHTDSFVPTMATRPTAQLLVGSSQADTGARELRRIRDAGRKLALNPPRRRQPTYSRAYLEWCARPPEEVCDLGVECDHEPTTPGCGCDKLEVVAEANAGYVRGRISAAFLVNERSSMSGHGYGVERMGWWGPEPDEDEDEPEKILDLDKWAELEDDDPDNTPTTMSCFGLELDKDRALASIGASGLRSDGPRHVEVVERRRGTGWIVPKCKELDAEYGPAKFGIDGHSAAGADLAKKLEKAGLDVVVLGTADVLDATAGLADAVDQELVMHGPQQSLNDSVEGARRRYIGDRYVVAGRTPDVDVTPIKAVIIAHWLDADDYDVMDSIL